jgi:predicted ester cyclase
MSETNKAAVRRFYDEIFNGKNLDVIDEMCDVNFVDHSPLPNQAPGRQGVKDVLRLYTRAFPDMRVTVEELIGERDLVAARFTGQGTHLGELFGTPPTGRKIVFNGIDVIRFRDGKAVEVWHQGDDMIGLMQIGIKLPIPSV